MVTEDCNSFNSQRFDTGGKPESADRMWKEKMSSPVEAEVFREWEAARCPACMEHPHSAVLLTCSNLDKGCRPFICNTGDRHSNCLYQFCKSCPQTPISLEECLSGCQQLPTLLCCPLCRGEVTAWDVDEPARRYMNAKARSCSHESCGFSGTYRDLRSHARREHPCARPSDVEAERRRDWAAMGQRLDTGDLLSAMQSPPYIMPSDRVLELRVTEIISNWLANRVVADGDRD